MAERRLTATRTVFPYNLIRQAFHDLEILHAGGKLQDSRLEIGVEAFREVIEGINGDPVFAPAAEKREFDVSRAENADARGFYIPWGPDVEEGKGFNAWPPSQILVIRGIYGVYEDYGARQYTGYNQYGVDGQGYFIERTWPTYKLYFPGGLHENMLEVVARYPLLIPESYEEIVDTENPFTMQLPPNYYTLIRCRLVKTLAPSFGAGFPVVLASMLSEAEENIRNRNFDRALQESDFAHVGDDQFNEDYDEYAGYGGGSDFILYHRS